ncbi:tryptophan--tRNA ligase [Candidatus Falkowbacteria bacterium]|nr:tryptophan--tRNA ligase [Candidatus Falkowbacteria bacterium]
MGTANKKSIFSGVKPSGDLHLGNYLGALSQWAPLQEEYNCIFCVVDLHAITVKQDPELLNQRIIEITKHYLASGIDPAKSIIFQQSAVTAHAELAWLLNCTARIADLNKMTQFKEKAGKNQETVSVGLYDYPVLMAADILLYNTEIVPVGEDQVQHVELARELAKRFNHQFGETFIIPAAKVRKEGARIMGLDNPTKKMGKSDTASSNYIAMLDNPSMAAKKIMRAATDSEATIKYDKENKPGISNLLTIYSILFNAKIDSIEKKYAGKGYGEFKKDLAVLVENFLVDYQKRFNSYSNDDIIGLLKSHAEKVRPIAEKTLTEAKQKIGLRL